MIPKIIHYAWFGHNTLPPIAVNCIQSWEKYCPDYEIRRWDESNYNYRVHPYTREAYANRKYAFVTDYLRLDVLYQFGGIFFDTDVEVVKNFDPLLSLIGFTGFEHGENKEPPVNVGIGIGAGAGNPIIKAMLDDYLGRKFVLDNGELNMTPCPFYQTQILKKYGLVLENRRQDLGDMVIFPIDYFCPMDYYTSKVTITPNTYSIHHYSASWMPIHRRVWHFLTQKIPPLRTVNRWRKKLLGKDTKL
jgi:hypothetical protein